MRLNDKTFPMLPFLDGRASIIDAPIDISIIEDFKKGSPEKKILYLTALQKLLRIADKKYFITDTFADAILRAEPKIVQDDKWLYPKSQCGILYQRDSATVYMTDYSDKVKLALFGFLPTGHVCYCFLQHDGMMHGVYWMTQPDGTPRQDDLSMNRWVNRVLITLYFIDNCEIETIEWKPKQKHRYKNKKYFNESKSNITILDCSWFTEIVSTTPVNVKSFLRWQACGAKHEKRKLVWVAEHKRTYSRKAKKPNDGSTGNQINNQKDSGS